jgi:hypothetical protein
MVSFHPSRHRPLQWIFFAFFAALRDTIRFYQSRAKELNEKPIVQPMGEALDGCPSRCLKMIENAGAEGGI